MTTLPTELPTDLEYLKCFGNNIQKLLALTQCTKLEFVDCDLVCFESYMLAMANVEFELFINKNTRY